MRHGLISPINTVFSRQSHCINCAEIRPLYFFLTGQQWDFVLAPNAWVKCAARRHFDPFVRGDQKRDISVLVTNPKNMNRPTIIPAPIGKIIDSDALVFVINQNSN